MYAINQSFKIETIFNKKTKYPRPSDHIKNSSAKKPKYPRRSEPFDSVSTVEGKSHFSLDKYWRPKKYVQNEFELIKNGKVVADHATGLMWQQGGSGECIKYYDALKYVKHLNSNDFSGFTDWRMPTVDELTSLLTRYEQKDNHCWNIDPLFASNQRSNWSWIKAFLFDSSFHSYQGSCWSSDKASMEEKVWIVYFQNAGVFCSATASSDDLACVRVVRAGQ